MVILKSLLCVLFGSATLSYADQFQPYEILEEIPSREDISTSDYELLSLVASLEALGCPLHEHWEFCTGNCERNCSNYGKPLMCPDICIGGCNCDRGYTRGPLGNCILATECPDTEVKQAEASSLEKLGCPLHEHWEFCTGNCERNCSNYGKPLMCPDICIGGCNCDRGYTRGPLGNCILATECPSTEVKQAEDTCGSNEHYSRCGALPKCQKTCSNYKEDIPCIVVCHPGCICNEGYVKGPEGNCIPVEQCASEISSKLKQNKVHICPEGEHYSRCQGHPTCQRTCSNPYISFSCTFTCVEGCVCDRGSIRGPDGRCVPIEQCASLNNMGAFPPMPLPVICPMNELFSFCASACPDTCYSFKRKCSKPCVLGCQCQTGYVRGPSEKCIRPEECPMAKSLRCPENQHWEVYTAHCAKNCSNFSESIPCRPACVSGCVCDTGYVFDSAGRCIPPSQCHPQTELNSQETEDFCPPNEEFSPCLAHCQRNCINWSDPSLPCLKFCTPGCICKKRMVRGPHGTCIRLRQCPSRKSLREMAEIECPVDEHFVACSAHCQKQCANYNESTSCPRVCIPGCVCDAGMVRGPTGKCIYVDKCPVLEEKKKNETNANETTPICPNGEHRSEFQALFNSPSFCIHGTRCYLDICPVSYFKGCVCDNGLTRGPGNRCVDSRLKARTNDLHFMHESPYVVNEGSNQAMDREELQSENSESEMAPTVEPERGSCDTTLLSNEDIILSFLNDSSHYKVDLGYGCTNRESCLDWCKTRGIRNGVCVGNMPKICTCLEYLE